MFCKFSSKLNKNYNKLYYNSCKFLGSFKTFLEIFAKIMKKLIKLY